MREDRQRYGSLIAAAGAALLAVSVFLPWYGLSWTASGIAYAQQEANNAALQYGNAALQSQIGSLSTAFGSLAGHQFATVSAHEALKYVSVMLLILAAVAFAVALLRLAGSSQLSLGSGQLAVVGGIATACVLFRMADPPAPPENLFSLSLGAGIWLALGSSLAILAGGLWPLAITDSDKAVVPAQKGWDGLSGWTP